MNISTDSSGNFNFRLTPIREAMLKIFETSDCPMTAIDIVVCLKNKGLRPNKTTIYREIKFLLDKTIVKELNLRPGISHYELSSAKHHHHFVCTNCENIQNITDECSFYQIENNLKEKYGFEIVSHSADFFGVCKNCKEII